MHTKIEDIIHGYLFFMLIIMFCIPSVFFLTISFAQYGPMQINFEERFLISVISTFVIVLPLYIMYDFCWCTLLWVHYYWECLYFMMCHLTKKSKRNKIMRRCIENKLELQNATSKSSKEKWLCSKQPLKVCCKYQN